jgi:hypothetical protein
VKRITEKNYLRWLKSKDPGEKVGFPNTGNDCPIANFAKSLGYKEVEVGYGVYTARGLIRAKTPFLGRPIIRNDAWILTALQVVDQGFTRVVRAGELLEKHREVAGGSVS